jgi:hypothetical protein
MVAEAFETETERVIPTGGGAEVEGSASLPSHRGTGIPVQKLISLLRYGRNDSSSA